MMLARHSPGIGAGKIFAIRAFMIGLFMMGINYILGWIIDQPFNRVAFLIVAGVGLIIVLAFFMVIICCRHISRVHTDDDED